MAIRTFSAQDSYKRGGTEPRKKLKKVRSVKVANLDKLRSSMKRDKNRFYRGVEASTDELTEPNSAAICGTSSPNYMKATTSSSARKGSLQSSSGSAAKNESSASSVKSASKINRVSVQDYSDPAGVNIPVKVKSEKILKRVPSLKTSKRLSSKKSMRIRARYSQFSDFGIDQGEMMEIDTESLIASSSNDQDFMTGMDVKQKGVLERSRSRKMTRLRSIRSSRARQMQKFRFSGDGKDIVPFEAEVLEPHYMKATTSQQARKISDKGLARTSSLRPLRILAKIPSLRPKRSKVKKRPQGTPLSGTSVNRPTCSSTLKRNQFSEDIELHSGDRELDGTSSSLHVCPYSYCSIHGHRHHTPPQPLKEFISAKRKLFNNQKGEQPESRGGVHVASAPETETDQSEHKFSTESYAEVHETMWSREENAPEDEDYGMDFLIKIYAKPRKKWATEGTLSQDAEAVNVAIYNQINGEQYKEKLAKTLSESSAVEEKKRELNDGQETHQQNSKISAISSPCEFHDISPKSVSADETLEPSVAEKLPMSPENPLERVSEASPHDYMTNILTDKQKYTSMWQLIYQELVSNEASMSEALANIQAEEQESDVGKFSHERSIKEDVDDGIAERKKLEIEQTAAIKLVQGALNAILQHDTKSYHQQSEIVQEVNNSFGTDGHLREGDQKDEKGIDLDPAEKQQNMKQIGSLLKNKDREEQGVVGEKVSKSLSKLRKMFMTAKFIKAMEGLKKINPHTPQHLSAQPISENERVYLRHLSIQERKNTEEWMLDYALKQVISRLDLDEQRRVAQLVEAFERVAPHQEEMSDRPFPLASTPDPGRELAIPTNGEKKQFVEPIQDLPFSCDQLVETQDAGALVFHHDVPEGKKLIEEYTYLVNKTDDEIMQESAEAEISGSTMVLSDTIYKSASFDKASYDEGTVNEKPGNTLKFPSENPIQDSEVSPTDDMTSIFINKQKYTSMWNLIYQHVSSEASTNENQEIEGVDEEEKSHETNSHIIYSRDSTSSMDQKEDNYDKNLTREKPDLDQSTAIKLVKEALSAILKHYEQPTNTESIQDHDKTLDNAREICLPKPASHTEKCSTDVENSSLPLQQEVESGDKFEKPKRKMSKSLSKLKKAIATTRFIKAMERLMKNSPRKSQILHSDTTLEDEKVHLRHRSMNGRKKDEEWMLDYALRQVVSKLDPDQQRRVASLVEAFETMHPEQKDMRIRYALKGEATNCNELATCKSDVNENNLQSQQQQSLSIKKVHHKQDDGILLSIRDAFPERNEDDPQASSADGILVEEINVSRISDSTSESSEHESKILASAAVKLEEQRVEDKETGRDIEFTSPLPTGKAEVETEGEMASILFDKQKYTSMWHLIYQHVLSNEASTTGKQEVNDDEEEQDDNANNFCALNDPGSTQSTQLKKSKEDNDKQSAASDQSAAIYLVKEAIHAILQSHEQKSNQQSLEDHGRGACKSTAALASTEEDFGQKKIEEHRDTELEEKLHVVENTSVPLQQVAEPKEATRKMSKSLSKLKRAIVTTKFIKAMERLRKISPRKPRHVSAEASSEEERVYLRHLSINARKNGEEWMLDYALRKVISDLAPDQQRKVAQLVGAFEKVNSGQKGTRNETRAEGDLTVHYESKADKEQILEYKQESSTACESNILPMRTDKLSMLQTLGTLEKNVLEDENINPSNLKMELPHKILDLKDSNSDTHHQANSKGNPVSENILTRRDEIDEANPTHEPIQPSKDSLKDNNFGITKGLFCDKQKNSNMWLLIYQHVKSVSDTESGSKPIEILINEDQQNKDDASAEMIDDDSVDSSVATELTENDAIKLVREAINDILDAPKALKNESSSGNKAAEDHSKSLSRGYSKLKKLIICNKFIKAMEKTRKFDSEKQPNLELNSGSEMGKAQLKTSRVDERKGMDEWMLDNVLQKAIAGLAPIKQKRVALLVEAFEKVNTNPEESGKGPSCSETEFPDPISLEGDATESENTKTLQKSKLPCSFNLKLEGSTCWSEATTARVQQEIHKDKSPVLTKETLPDGGNRKSDGLCTTTAAASVAINTLSHTNNQRTEIDGANESRVPLEEIITFRDRSGDQHQEKTPTFADKSLQPDDLEGKWNHGAQDSGPLRKSSSLWGLILQRVTVDMLEKGETPKATIDVDAQEVKDKVLEREIDESCQPASKVKSCRDMGVQTPASFHFEEDEAVKLVEEAVEEMLLVQDQLSDAESMTSSTISEQEVHSQNNGDKEESSPTATQITGVTESFQLANPDEEKLPKKENLLKSYSTLSKIMMCKRFIKAMDKRRKLKPASTQEVAQPSHVEEGIPSLRQITTSNKNGLEEGMLDHALQKVIGNLAPAKKQRVALLVQAFEAVGSQPEPRSSWRGKVSVS